MDYAKAAALVKQHAPDLTIDPEVPGQPHIVVRRDAKATPHSIMIPVSTATMPLTEELIEASLVLSIADAQAST